MKRFMTVFVALTLALALATIATAGGDCECKEAKATGGWCDGCSAGFFGDMVLTSKKLHGALQAKPIPADKLTSLPCDGCKTAIEEDGTCESCHVTFVKSYAFRSPYAAALAQGQPMQWDEKAHAAKKAKGEAADCQGCEAAAKAGGWCNDCSVGFVGSHIYKDKVEHKNARKALTMIQRADRVAKSCESCAVAMVTDSKCGGCKIAYRNGKKIRL